MGGAEGVGGEFGVGGAGWRCGVGCFAVAVVSEMKDILGNILTSLWFLG